MSIAGKNRLWLVFGFLFTLPAVETAAEESGDLQIDEIVVIGVTPTRSGGLDAHKIAANVQSVSNAALERQHNLDLTEFMNRNLGSVFVNEAQNNPLQPDVQFRGFVASPLLGLPQGISVYQDGVRINEPFGDTVNWALIPKSAIATMDLIPGSNPLFGLNTLGGALSVRTKRGSSHPGSRAEISAGSFQRVNAVIETGGSNDGKLGYYATAAYFQEDGWREFSPSESGQFFGDLSFDSGELSMDLSLNVVQTELIGNGPAPTQLLDIDRRAIFTRPDITENDLSMLNLRAGRRFGGRISLDGNVYARSSDVDTVNGDESEFSECQQTANAGFMCGEEDGEEEILEDALGNPIAFDESLEGAAVNRSQTAQDSFGGTLQFTFRSERGGRSNQFILGGSLDSSQIEFRNSTELAALDETRLAVPGGVFVGEAFTSLQADVDHRSLYFTDTLSPTEAVAITVSARFNNSEIVLRDQLGTALNGHHSFERLNPAVGVTYRFSPALGLYLGYSESNRIPTPVELTCADSDDPCRLPNAFLADPPLNQVVGKSWEVGARGHRTEFGWHLGLFRTANEDDIIFVSAGAVTNRGFFSNVGETVRQGVEASLQGQAFDRLDWFVNYTYLQATFEEYITLASANNPEAIDGEVFVQPGDRLPLVPDQLLKAGLDLSITPKLSAGATLLYAAEIFFRGDEGNDTHPVPSYAVVNLRGEYEFNQHASLFVTMDNMLDTDYETFGLFGQPEEVLGDEFDDPRFMGPGAPRAAWIGLTFAW